MLFGANWLVNGCVSIARRLNISEFIVSVLIIGIGTSMPELLIAVLSSARDSGELAVSNSIASNIINVLGVLGIGILIRPIEIKKRAYTKDIAFVWLASCALMYAVSDGNVSLADGFILIAIFAAYAVSNIKHTTKLPSGETAGGSCSKTIFSNHSWARPALFRQRMLYVSAA